MTRPIPLHTLDGVPNAQVTTHRFWTGDGLELSMLRFRRAGGDDGTNTVLVVHGLTTSSDMFIMPEHRNLVTHLLDNGFGDVWTLDFRMSNRHPYNRTRHRFTLDDVALYDFPAALKKLRATAGERRIHVVAHCLGSVSFLMSLFGGAVDGIASVVANSVGLTPRVPTWSRMKLTFAPTLMEGLGFDYLDPDFHQRPARTREGLFARAVDVFHRECDTSACHMLSLMWGTGWPALYEHENLHEVTHTRAGDLYGTTGFNYYRHVRAMLKAGNAVKYAPRNPRYAALPDDYLAGAPGVSTPVLFTTGERNRVFVDSNVVCHRMLERLSPGRHELKVFPGYGHQDVFMGAQVATDIFPSILDFLKRQAA